MRKLIPILFLIACGPADPSPISTIVEVQVCEYTDIVVVGESVLWVVGFPAAEWWLDEAETVVDGLTLPARVYYHDAGVYIFAIDSISAGVPVFGRAHLIRKNYPGPFERVSCETQTIEVMN